MSAIFFSIISDFHVMWSRRLVDSMVSFYNKANKYCCCFDMKGFLCIHVPFEVHSMYSLQVDRNEGMLAVNKDTFDALMPSCSIMRPLCALLQHFAAFCTWAYLFVLPTKKKVG